MPIESPTWHEPLNVEEEVALAEEFNEYPRHVLAFALSKIIVQHLAHPDLVRINIELSATIPEELFEQALKDRKHAKSEQH